MARQLDRTALQWCWHRPIRIAQSSRNLADLPSFTLLLFQDSFLGAFQIPLACAPHEFGERHVVFLEFRLHASHEFLRQTNLNGDQFRSLFEVIEWSLLFRAKGSPSRQNNSKAGTFVVLIRIAKMYGQHVYSQRNIIPVWLSKEIHSWTPD
jgi:hypothetical protein